MHERVETTLFSVIAVLVAAITLAGLAGLAFPDVRAVPEARATQYARYGRNPHWRSAMLAGTLSAEAAFP